MRSLWRSRGCVLGTLTLAAAALAMLPCRIARAAAPLGDNSAGPLADNAARPLAAGAAGSLIEALGSDKYAERQRASRALESMGVAAKDALLAAIEHPDAEVRSRARDILASITALDFRQRLEAFSADYDGHARRTLPGWERFSKLFGSHQQARQLFVEMAREEPVLLEAYAVGDKAATEALQARCEVLLESFMQVAGREALFPVGTLATLLFIGAEPNVVVNEQAGAQLYTWMIYQPAFSQNARGGPWAATMKQLLGRWIVKDATPSATMQNLIFAASYDLHEDGLTLARRILSSAPATPQLHQYALLALGRFGGRAELALLEKHLDDATVCGMLQLGSPVRQVELQLRDVALAVALQTTGQDAKSYGTISPHGSPQSLFKVPLLAFSNTAEREAAFKRWGEWRHAHPEP